MTAPALRKRKLAQAKIQARKDQQKERLAEAKAKAEKERQRKAKLKFAKTIIKTLNPQLESLALIQQKLGKSEAMKDKLSLRRIEWLAAQAHEMASMAHKAVYGGEDFEGHWTIADVKTTSDEMKRTAQRFSKP